MEQSGQYRIAAPRQRVWEALNDPEVLKACIPGCQALTRSGENTLHAVVQMKIGPLSASFEGDVALQDLDPPNGYTLDVSAKGGAAGFAKGTAKVALAEDGAETTLSYQAEGRVGGKLAQVGQRLIDAAARKTADDFFEAFAREVAPAPPASAAARAEGPGSSAAAWRARRLVWLAIAIAAVVALVVHRLAPR
jgi:carbon monoxide dehydrogenase subunit G